jgi:hypothetical protein
MNLCGTDYANPVTKSHLAPICFLLLSPFIPAWAGNTASATGTVTLTVQ